MPANALTIVHKFIRSELFEVARIISCAGPGDTEKVRTALSEVTALLHEHAAHEESGFEPQLRELNPDHADRLLGDHHRLHADLDRVNVAAEKLDASDRDACADALLQLHLDWNRFLAGYLMHLDDEERTLFASSGSHLIPPIEVMAEAVSQEEDEGEAFLKKLYVVIAPREREAIERARTRVTEPAG